MNNPILATESALQPAGLLHTRGIAGSGLPPLSNIPHCCLPQESGPCLSPSVADHPLKPAKDRSLGKPLPYQQANLAQAHPMARAEALFTPWRLCGINSSFLELSPSIGQIPMYYSPVRHCTRIRRYFLVQLACMRPAASVQSEP